MITVRGQQVQLWVGDRREDKKAPLLFYWHGTGSASVEASAFMTPQIDEVVADGGMVASFTTSTGLGEYTGPFVWYSGDFEMTDLLVACANEQLNIDKRRIFSAGCSAGGLQSISLAYARSSYLAGAMPNSGGTIIPPEMVDPSHIPAVMTTHGAPGVDKVSVLDFSEASAVLGADLAQKGGFVVNCNHGGGHCGVTPDIVAAQWQFMKDHPFGITTDPYADGLPASFPASCQVIR